MSKYFKHVNIIVNISVNIIYNIQLNLFPKKFANETKVADA